MNLKIFIACVIIAILAAVYITGTNPSKLMHKYEWFKTQYNDIQQITVRTGNAKAAITQFKLDFPEISKWDWQTKDEYTRLNAVHQGYQSQLAALISEYNAQSSKFNWAGLKTADLPYRIDLPE